MYTIRVVYVHKLYLNGYNKNIHTLYRILHTTNGFSASKTLHIIYITELCQRYEKRRANQNFCIVDVSKSK